jgi:tRNA threonylcarbamoyladenosine biosynthesis protein TsaE
MTVTNSTSSASPAETEALGARLAGGLGPGDIVLVAGELGVGKTTLIRGGCRALGVDGPITSPTFTIGHRYTGRLPVSHLDLFRLGGLEDEDPALLDDYIPPDAIAFVEWPEVGGGMPELTAAGRVVRVAIRFAGGDAREVEITGQTASAPETRSARPS